MVLLIKKVPQIKVPTNSILFLPVIDHNRHMESSFSDKKILRRISTREHIAYVMRVLMESKPLNKITLKELLDTSGVSRTSFYRYYKDKYDVVTEIYKEEVKKLSQEHDISESWNAEVMLLMYNNREFLQHAFKEKEINSLWEYVVSLTRNDCIDAVKKKLAVEQLPDEYMASIDFYCAGCLYTIENWINDGWRESPDAIAKIMEENKPSRLAKIL